MSARVPERLRWAVRVLDISPEDQVLEIGCGSGVAVSLIGDQLAGGCITAIDRSATAIKRATERNADHVASGKAVLRQVDLAAFTGFGRRFDKVFAVNVNLFWVRPADPYLMIIKEHLRRDGVLHLFYERPGSEKASHMAKAVTAALSSQGFSTVVTSGPSPSLYCVSARPISDNPADSP